MQFNLTLSPAQQQFILKPGASFTQAYQLTNHSNSTLILNTSLEAWQALGTDGSLSYNPALNNPDLSFSLQNADLKLGQAFQLHPGESKQLVLKIKASSTAQNTDSYYTFFISQDLNSQIPNSSNSQNFARLGSHLLLSISDTQQLTQKAQFQNLKTTPKLKDSGLVHLMVASGTNVMLLSRFFIEKMAYWVGRKTAIVFGLGILWWYTSMLDYEAPILRAVLLISVFYTAQLLGRRFNLGRALVFSVGLMLLVKWSFIKEYGF